MGLGFSPTRAPHCAHSLFLSSPSRALAQPPFIFYFSLPGFPGFRPTGNQVADRPATQSNCQSCFPIYLVERDSSNSVLFVVRTRSVGGLGRWVTGFTDLRPGYRIPDLRPGYRPSILGGSRPCQAWHCSVFVKLLCIEQGGPLPPWGMCASHPSVPSRESSDRGSDLKPLESLWLLAALQWLAGRVAGKR